GAMYLFPKIETKMYPIKDEQKMVLDCLVQEKVLLVQGSGSNWPKPDHFRIVTLPHVEALEIALSRFERFITTYTQ
ncbi:aminotransferase, partial [Vibrio cholerae]|nr:aminotransferase [Vibrio cholerae]